jgi:hypothetical protein
MSENENIWEGAECARTIEVAGFHLPVHDQDLWFEQYFESKAKAVCGTCPIQLKCLDYAVTNKETEGVWGGLTAPERRLLKKGN